MGTKGKIRKWSDLSIAIIGGDEREQEIARLAAATGATITAYGFPWPENGIDGVSLRDSAVDAIHGAHIALMPIPGIQSDGSLFATTKIIPRDDILGAMAPQGHIILGTADEELKACAKRHSITIHEYEQDDELMLLRTPAIVEGAIRNIIELTDITIHNARICVAGQGNIGAALTRTLVLMGGQVSVLARNPVQRALAFTVGADAFNFDSLVARAREFDIVVSTIPAPTFTREIIDLLPKTAVLVDLSAPPGSIELGYAKQTGLQVSWARGLGRRAPITVGASQWVGIRKIIEAQLLGGHNGEG